jgi:EmrB/QacA subfamily drug resistance transporter
MLHHISTRQKLIVMLAVMSGLFLVALDQTIVSTALGAIVKEFNSYSSLGFVVTAYMLTTTVTVPLAGKLSDMYGRRLLLLCGVAIFTLGSLLSGLAPSIEWLIIWRALQGVGGGIITANAFTIVGDLFSPRERGKWQGLIGAVFGMSSVVGPLLGGWLTDGVQLFGITSDWRWTFLINVPIGLIAAAVIARYCPPIRHDGKHYPDYAGAALITVALSSLILAVDNTETIFKFLIDQGVTLGFIRGTLLVITILSATLFLWVERRAKQPILPLRFFANKTYRLMVIVSLLFGAAFLGTILYLTQFNQQVFGATASSAGLMLLPMVGGMTVGSITTGQLIARFGRYKRFIVAGFALTAVSILALITLQPDSPYWHEAIIMSVCGLGLGMAMPVLSLAVQNEFEQRDLGAATASVQLFRGLGSTVGTALFASVLTTGIMTSLGNPQTIPYIQTLQQSPAAAQMFSGELNADTLLRINMSKRMIQEGAEQGISHLKPPVRDKILGQLQKQQEDFSKQVIQAFTVALHHIFMIGSVLMVLALAVVTFVEEKKLRDTPSLTGE